MNAKKKKKKNSLFKVFSTVPIKLNLEQEIK